MKRFYKIIGLAGILWLIGCGNGKTPSTPTSGEARIAIDESYSLLFDTEIYTFQSLYKDARLNPIYTTESEAVDMLLKDSADVIVLNRELSDQEKEIFKQASLYPKHVKILEDAVAFV